MHDTQQDDVLHLATILEPGETYRGAHGIRITNPSEHTFDMHVQVVDEINFTVYRSFSPGQGFMVYSIQKNDE